MTSEQIVQAMCKEIVKEGCRTQDEVEEFLCWFNSSLSYVYENKRWYKALMKLESTNPSECQNVLNEVRQSAKWYI